VGTEVEDLDDEVFEEKLAAAQVELRKLASRATTLETGVDKALTELLARSVALADEPAEPAPIDGISHDLDPSRAELEGEEAV